MPENNFERYQCSRDGCKYDGPGFIRIKREERRGLDVTFAVRFGFHLTKVNERSKGGHGTLVIILGHPYLPAARHGYSVKRNRQFEFQRGFWPAFKL